jgi:solute carrier family 13 (sodium-dependent dicarboxylate transporter), member 2/3/5
MKSWIAIAATVILTATVPHLVIESTLTASILSIAAVCLLLWLFELTAPFVPTFLLWVLIPLVLSPLDAKYSLANTLKWAADPVLALFFGGFVLGVATERHDLDRRLALWAFKRADGSFSWLLLLIILLTAFMSMWISNIAAAALMFACMRPLLTHLNTDAAARRTLLIGVALGANLGGMATPVGTGPNAIAIASLAGKHQVTFIDWMTFALPLTLGMLVLGFVILRWMAGKIDESWTSIAVRTQADLSGSNSIDGLHRRRNGFLAILLATAILWLSEPLHGIPSAVVALAAATSIFLFGLLKKEDLSRIDWSTLLLIAGGITLGRMFEASGIIAAAAAGIPFDTLHPTLTLLVMCLASALLSALMSNTATAVLLIPLATMLVPDPSTAILVAISASFGMPFVISTPPNAMAYGEGGLRTSDLLVPGLIILVVGCILVSLTGRPVLRLAGFP